MSGWGYSHGYPAGYDVNGTNHDDRRGLFYLFLRGVFWLAAMAFWHSSALCLSYGLLVWLRTIIYGLKDVHGWIFFMIVMAVAASIAALMARLFKYAKALSVGTKAWFVCWSAAALYGLVLPALIWRTVFVVCLGWWKEGSAYSWLSWVMGFGIGVIIFQRKVHR